MRKSLRNCVKGPAFTAALLAATALLLPINSSLAEDVDMPTAAEVQYFSPEAQQFYAAGVAALDRADYENGYNMLAKAAALQPMAANLNNIVARLAIYKGRQTDVNEARDYYQTAIACYENILNIPTLSTDMRRQTMTQLKLASQEGAELAQRDAIREATGTSFILDFNRRYASKPARAAGTLMEATTSTETVESNPVAEMLMMEAAGQGFGGMTALAGEAGGFDVGVPDAMPAGPGGVPGEPGALPPPPPATADPF